MRILLSLVLLFFVQSLSAQTADTSATVVIDENLFEKVEVEASVDPLLWRRHLETNLMPVIENAAKKGIKAGQYTVNVRFIVERDGSISNVKAMNNPGFGLAKGAEKVVKTSPKWKPGMQNGRIVRSYHTQPIVFVISEE